MLIDSAVVVTSQVFILFLLLSVGFIMGKIKWLTARGLGQMTQLLLMVVTPCVIIDSFQTEFSVDLLSGLLIAAISSIVTHLVAIVFSKFVFRSHSEGNRRILRFAVIFSNCGFMCIPLLQAVLGPIGVFYGSAYIAVFNVIIWTYGIVLMTGDKKDINLRKALINPGVIGLALGLPLFLSGFQLPEIPGTVIGNLAALNTPLAMIIIGAQMSGSSLLDIWRSKANYLVAVCRLLIVPIIILGLLAFLPLDRTLLIACVIPASAPVAATTSLFATRFRQNTLLATYQVSMTTILSIITMPIMILLSDIVLLLK